MAMGEMGFAGTAALGAAILVGSSHTTAYGVDEETRTEFSSAVEFGFRLLAVSSLTYVYNTPKVTGYGVALFLLTRLKTSKTGDNDANVVWALPNYYAVKDHAPARKPTLLAIMF